MLDQCLQDFYELLVEVAKTDNTVRVRSKDILENMITAQESQLLLKYVDGVLAGGGILVNKKYYDEPLETYAFMNELIVTKNDLTISDPNIYWLTTICVNPKMRRQGIASGLLNDACEYACSASEDDCVVALATMKHNIAMQKIAEKAGMHRIDKMWSLSDFVRENDIIEEKDLGIQWYIYYKILNNDCKNDNHMI